MDEVIAGSGLTDRVELVLQDYRDQQGQFDAIVSIGLLMFFDCATARRVLADVRAHVRPGGVAVVNVLVEGMILAALSVELVLRALGVEKWTGG